MKIFKRGFTLAEVIFCLGIVGIVTALGLKVTNDSAQRAYNKYWSTGYENLYDVLYDLKTARKVFDTNGDINEDTLSDKLNEYFNLGSNSNGNGKNASAFSAGDKVVATLKFGFKHILAEHVYDNVNQLGSCFMYNENGQCKRRNAGDGSGGLVYQYACNDGNGVWYSSDKCEQEAAQDAQWCAQNPDAPVCTGKIQSVAPTIQSIEIDGENDESSGEPTVKTKNAIGYNVAKITLETGNVVYLISMKVPQPRKEGKDKAVTMFLYNPKIMKRGNSYESLQPLTEDDARNNLGLENYETLAPSSEYTYVDVRNNVSLLSFVTHDNNTPIPYNTAACIKGGNYEKFGLTPSPVGSDKLTSLNNDNLLANVVPFTWKHLYAVADGSTVHDNLVPHNKDSASGAGLQFSGDGDCTGIDRAASAIIYLNKR